MNPEEARGLVESMRDNRRYAGAWRLAVAASLAVRVEPELVRELRLTLFPEVEAGAEADFWLSPLVRTRTQSGIELEPGVVEPLRQELAREQEVLRGAWRVLAGFHRGAPRALRLEEELTFLSLSDDPEDARLVVKRLESVRATLEGGQRPGLARWANRALQTLPPRGRDTDAARLLSFVAGVQTGRGPALEKPPGRGLSREWLQRVTGKEINPVKVGLRLLKKEGGDYGPLFEPDEPLAHDAEVSGAGGVASSRDEVDETPMLVEVSLPPAPFAEVVEVPDTYRLVFEVSWGEGDSRPRRQLSVFPGETRHAEVGYGPVSLNTPFGETHTLRPRFDQDFIVLHRKTDTEIAKRLYDRIERQPKFDGSYLRGSIWSLDVLRDDGGNTPAGSSLINNFQMSRKVVLIVPPLHEDELELLDELWPARFEPKERLDWLVPIDVGFAPRLRDGRSALDFIDPGGFEHDFRVLWFALTGERLPAPPETQPKEEPETKPIRLFYSYAHEDERLLVGLQRHLAVLRREGLISEWHDREINVGQEWAKEINAQLDAADIILLLISPNFLASDYVYDVEAKRAMERHEAGEAVVIPVILRPVEWQSSAFGKLQALPEHGRPVTTWANHDEAFANVADGIYQVALNLRDRRRGQNTFTSANIPRPPAVGFVARRDEHGRDILERLKEELAPGRGRLVALWGPGGSGKSTLAAELARALRPAFNDRLAWVSALGRSDFSLSTLLDDIATQLGSPGLRTLAPAAKEEHARALLSASPALVVLDNFETIKPEEQTACAAFLASCGECSALITTRAPVNRDDVTHLRLDAMSADEAQEMLGRLIASSHDPRIFTSTLRERIVTEAEANPLVMQWLVGQMALARDPDEVFEDLARGEGDAVERVFGRTFDLPQLGDDGRAVTLALTLFSPHATFEALAEVSGLGVVSERLLGSIKVAADAGVVSRVDGDHLALRGLVRGAAAARLAREPERLREVRRRFVSYFRRFAESHHSQTDEDFAALEAEKDNLVAAVSAANELGDWGDVLALALILAQPGKVLTVRGYWADAETCCDAALQAALHTGDRVGVANWSLNLGGLRRRRGELVEARGLFAEALEIARDLEDQRLTARALKELGNVAQELGAFDEARRYFEESLNISRELGDQASVATALGDIGRVEFYAGDFDRAHSFYEESLHLLRELGLRREEAVTLNNLGAVVYAEGAAEAAKPYFEQSLSVMEQLGDQAGVVANLSQLGRLAADFGDAVRARALFERSLEIYQRLSDQRGLAESLFDLGRLSATVGERAEAGRLYREALKISEQLKSPQTEDVRRALEELEGSGGGGPGSE